MRCYQVLKELIQSGDEFSEKYVPATKVVEQKPFMWLGFTDASYVELAEQGVPVITADFKLYQQVAARSDRSINFAALSLSNGA